MSIEFLRNKPANAIKLICAVNFKAALIFLLLFSVVSVFDQPLYFDDYQDLYGPMIGNLRLMLIYLAVTDLAIYGYCHFSNNYQAVFIMGVFLLSLILGVEAYGLLNQVPIDDNYAWFFLYLGASHLSYAHWKVEPTTSNT